MVFKGKKGFLYLGISYAREYSLGWWEAMKALVVFVGPKPFPSKFLECGK